MATLNRLPAPIIPTRAGPNYRELFKSVGEGGQLLSVAFQTKDLLRFIDQETGRLLRERFPAMQRANERAAIAVQKGMRDELERQVGPRPQRTGHRLARAIMNERNRVVNPNNFQVGIESWLNSDSNPANAYWRTIEEGMAGYDTRALFYEPGGLVAPGEGGPHMRMRQYLGYQGGRQLGVAIHVSPIRAFHYSRGGIEAFGNLDMADLYIRSLRAAGFKNVTRDPKAGYFK